MKTLAIIFIVVLLIIGFLTVFKRHGEIVDSAYEERVEDLNPKVEYDPNMMPVVDENCRNNHLCDKL